jgi:hypothetical protein
MTLRALAFASLLLLSACVAGAPATRPAGQLQLVDLTDDFADHWERTRAMEDAARVAAFKSAFAALLPGFYDHQRTGLPTPERYDAHLLAALNRFPEERAGIADVSRRFAAMLEPAQRSFERHFGPLAGYPPIYLVHSLGEFDGGTRSLPEGVRLLFGADMIHRLYETRAVQPFFHHELFHLFHYRSFRDCAPVWCSLWTEGLATYVATQLNPAATDDELLLTSPEPLRAAVERDRAHAVCAVIARLGSTERSDRAALFSNGRLDERLPGRFGYYVGYLAAAELGRTHSLQQLAAMGPAQVRPVLEQALRRLATCPGA